MLNKKEKILIVDDNTQNLQYLGSILLEERYQIIAANNGKKALELAEQQVPDLILLDIMMPEMDGFETSQKLKENHKTNQIPIIFLTAKTELEDLQKGFNLGAVDYITKPFHPVELLLRLNTHLSLSKSQREYKELLHILSHDLDNYFGIIQGSIQAIESDYSDLPFYLPMLKESTHLGIELVKLVRDMRHIEEKPLKLEAVHLLTAFEYSKDILQPSYFKKNLSLELEIPDTIYILSERVSFISSVANNILSNAAKFSFNGSTVYVQARTEASQVIVSIKDTGIGIPKDILDGIYDIRKSTSRKGTNNERGTGFGIPLVQKFVSYYGGSLEIKSKVSETDKTEHGTEVILKLPLAKFQ